MPHRDANRGCEGSPPRMRSCRRPSRRRARDRGGSSPWTGDPGRPRPVSPSTSPVCTGDAPIVSGTLAVPIEESQSPTSRGGLCNAGIREALISEPYQFQSPTSRGGLCNVTSFVSGVVSRGMRFQSPTSRGGLCNFGMIPSASWTMWFQSPTSRGGLCNRNPDPTHRGHGTRFNPLLRGAAFATRPYRAPRVPDVPFQSPTSRGGLCNRARWPAASSTRRCFNPLLRGAASATQRKTPNLPRRRSVSIPYFAGRPLQREGPRATEPGPGRVSIPYFAGRPLQHPNSKNSGEKKARSFNPLLRGAASATEVKTACGGMERSPFQSPTSRGGLCNLPQQRGQETRSRVSIPYFAGRPLQRRGAAAHHRRLRRVSIPYFAGRPLQLRDPRLFPEPIPARFNPLLRGAASATATSTGVLPVPWGAVSIPYFAGRPLQLCRPTLGPGIEETVSIPYFAGRPLQRRLSLRARASISQVSIPYFAGRPLQLL